MPIGDIIGPYRVEGLLGQGGMGSVYSAVGPDGRPVAVKVLHARLTATDHYRRFQREGLMRMDHPNVVQVLDAGIAEDGAPYIVFERLHGESLAERIDRGPLSPAEVVNVGMQAAAGLAVAHARGVVHRDLKPANIFLCADGVVKVLDFGIAQASSEDTRLTQTGSVLGTPAFLAPEQARGERVLDERTDVWALGVVLYQALTGSNPFDRGSALATMLAALMEDAPPLAPRARAAPPELVSTIEHCLQKPREARWQTMEQLRRALGAVDLSAKPERPIADDDTSVQSAVFSMVPGEERVVAVLLAEAVRDPVALEEAVRARGGVALRLVGERLIGLFGGEATYGDEAERAAEAALASRHAAERLAVASGRAAQTGAAISGRAVKSAEDACAAGVRGIVVDAETARALTGQFGVRELVRADRGSGVTGLVELIGEAGAAPTVGSAAPIFGRDAELAQMRLAVDTVTNEGRALALLVTGPPGIGKSRLRREMEQIAPGVFATVLSGRAEPLRRQVAWHLLASALARRARTATRESGAPSLDSGSVEERRAAVGRLGSDVIADADRARACAAFLGEMLGVPGEGGAVMDAARSDAQLMIDRIRLAFREWMDALIARGPVALVLEDLQWADAASLEAIDDLLEHFRDAPLLLFATGRPELNETRPDLFAARDVTRLRLRGLGAPHVASLARAVARRPLPDGVLPQLAERTAGNPLFVEQIVLALEDTGVEKASTQSGRLPLPVSVEAAVQSRLDHLPAAEKDLVKRASVLGRPFTADELEGLGVREAVALTASLVKRDLVAPRSGGVRRGTVVEHQFKSTLVSEVAYAMLPPELRADLHRRAAEHLAARADGDPEEIALHWDRAGESARASERYASAALSAARRGDTQTVMRCSDRTLELGPPEAIRFSLHLARADALRFLGRRDEQALELDAAQRAAATDAERAAAWIELGVLRARTGRREEALQTFAEATAAARAAGDAELLAMARGRTSELLTMLGRLDESGEALDEATRLAASLRVQAFVTWWRAQLQLGRGDYGAALEAMRAASDRYREAGDLRRAAMMDSNVADLQNRIGAYGEAEQALRAAIEESRLVGNILAEGYASINLGYALWMQGRAEDAMRAIDRATAIGDQSRDARVRVGAALYRARVWAQSSPGEAAIDAERTALDAERAGLRAWRALALAVASAARLALGETTEALRLSSAAMALRDQLGGLEEDEAELFLAHAAALRAAGRTAEADDTLARGRARILAIASTIRDEVSRSRFLRDVPTHRTLTDGSLPLGQ